MNGLDLACEGAPTPIRHRFVQLFQLLSPCSFFNSADSVSYRCSYDSTSTTGKEEQLFWTNDRARSPGIDNGAELVEATAMLTPPGGRSPDRLVLPSLHHNPQMSILQT